MAYTWSATLWYDDIATVEHDQIGPARLLWQYRGEQPRLQSFLSTFLGQLQSIEDVSYQVLSEVWPLTAIGAQLDVLGRIVRQPRLGLVDEAYRLFILGRIFVNHGDGTWPDFWDLLEILGVTETMVGYEFWPAAMEIASSSVDYEGPVGGLLFDLKPGGVSLHWLYSDEADTDLFKTAETLAADQADADEGTENLAGTTGGRLMHLRYER